MKTNTTIRIQPKRTKQTKTALAARELKERKGGKAGLCVLCVLLWLILASTSYAATLYVWQAGLSRAPGDTVLATNGRGGTPYDHPVGV